MRKNNKRAIYSLDTGLLKDWERLTTKKQKQIPNEIKKMGLEMSERSYQRLFEENRKHTKDAITTIFMFFEKYFQQNDINVPITINALCKDLKEKANLFKGDPTNIDAVEDTVFLYPINSFNTLEKIIFSSVRRKFFYPKLPNNEQVQVMKEIINEITKIFNEQKGKRFKKKRFSDTANYDEIEKEIYQLDSFSSFSNSIIQLNEKGIYLYAGNYVLSNISGVERNEIDKVRISAGIHNTNYAIFCFDKEKSFSKTFKYINPYPAEKLKSVISKNPVADQVVDLTNDEESNWQDIQTASSYVGDHYYGFDPEGSDGIIDFNNFDRNRSKIYSTLIKELSEQQNKSLVGNTNKRMKKR